MINDRSIISERAQFMSELKQDILENLANCEVVAAWRLAKELYNQFEEYQALYPTNSLSTPETRNAFQKEYHTASVPFEKDVRIALKELADEGYVKLLQERNGRPDPRAKLKASITAEGRLIASEYASAPEDPAQAASFRERYIAERKSGKTPDSIAF